MERIIGVILLILTGVFLSISLYFLKDAIRENKKSKYRFWLTVTDFLSGAWDTLSLTFVFLALGLIFIF